MTLEPGTRFGPYEVVGSLGAGGMGEVYRARDARLARFVAIKILPQAVAADPERMARFEREAQVLASLNHSNIGAIYGIEESQGTCGLVLELVEGTNLAERLARGALSLGEALEIARQIAEGLEAAHERGVVHRDLKPANVQCTPDGTVKLLDFGLAKAVEPAATGSDPSLSPTRSAHMTQMGMILGTAAYMSPEQARGKPVDQRVDVWAFGCVLFEMLAGCGAFRGETVTDILGAIVHKDPDWDALPATTPAHVRRVLRRCLTRDLKQRFHAVGDVRIALSDPGESEPLAAPGAEAPRSSRALTLAALAAALLLGVVAGRLLWPAPASEATHTRRYSLEVDSIGGRGHGLAITPDGLAVVYSGGSPIMLRMRRLDRFESVPLAGTEGARCVVLSPDGAWAAFAAGTRIQKVRLEGGLPVTLHDFAPRTVDCDGGSWSADGLLYLGLWVGTDYGVLHRVPAAGGAAEVVIARDGPDGVPVERGQPQLLPGGRVLIYTAHKGNRTFRAEHAEIHAIDLTTGEDRTLLEHAGAGHYLHSGHLLAATATDRLTLTPFDASTVTITGPSVALPRMIGALEGGVRALFAATPDGMAVFRPVADDASRDELIWLGLDGTRTSIVAGSGFDAVALAPDGRRVAVSAGGAVEAGGLRLFDFERRAFTALTPGDEAEFSPVWSPDGAFVYFFRYSERTEPGLYRIAADGSGAAVRIADSRTVWFNPTTISPDGKFVAANIWDPDDEADWNLWIAPGDGSGPPQDFMKEPGDETWPRFSPDGRWLAFSSSRTGTIEVYVKSFPESGGLMQVSDGGGLFPIWNADGKSLLFVDPGLEAIYRADLDLAGSPRVSKPRRVLEIPLDLRTQNYRQFAGLDPAGERLLLVRPAAEWVDHLAVIENWFPEVRELAPPAR